MDLKQFAALKVGDRIENHMSNSTGEVVSIDETGVRLRWIGAGVVGSNAPTWHYPVNSTAWFHWNKVEPEGAGRPVPKHGSGP